MTTKSELQASAPLVRQKIGQPRSNRPLNPDHKSDQPCWLLHLGRSDAERTVQYRATELASAGVRVNVVTPGNALTPGADEIRQTVADAMGISLQDTTAAVPLGRAGDPRDIAEMVAYLASARAQWITGSNFVVDGGEHPAAFG